MMRIAAALAALLCLGAAKPVLVPDVSDSQVQIVYSFTGADLLLFGAILYPRGRQPDHPADVAVVLKGPTQSILVREKQKVAGMWLNADSARFRSAPTFYAIASSRPLGRLIDQRTAAIYELGLDSLQMSPASGAEPDVLVSQLAGDEAIAAADTLLLTVPNQLGVEYNAHVIESILKHVAPELGWR